MLGKMQLGTTRSISSTYPALRLVPCFESTHHRCKLGFQRHLASTQGGLKRCCIARARNRDTDRSSYSVPPPATFIPNTLLSSDYAHKEKNDANLTVYSIRFNTTSALSDLYTGVNVLLVGKDGRGILHRVSSLNDPQQATQDMEDMCKIVDDGVGADCSIVQQQQQQSSSPSSPTTSSSGYSLPPRAKSQPKLRFQQGCVDEVAFLAPELGPLAGIMVGTESGTWTLDEVHVYSSRTTHMDRFVCRRTLGVTKGNGASWLTPVPAGSVIYGSGESAVVLSKEQAAALRDMSLSEYSSMKQRLLMTTLLLTISGSGVAALAAGLDAAAPFALGGLVGVVYQWMLQQGVDSLVARTAVSKAGESAMRSGAVGGGASGGGSGQPKMRDLSATGGVTPVAQDLLREEQAQSMSMSTLVRNVAGAPAVRLGFVAAVAVLAVSAMTAGSSDSAMSATCAGVECLSGSSPREYIWKLALGMLGFMTYKVALVGVSAAPPVNSTASMSPGSKSKQYEKS